MHRFQVKSRQREQLVDITATVNRLITEHGADSKACLVFVPHTTAAVTINENADPDVARDIVYGLNLLVPQMQEFRHLEGNSDAHIKSSLVGASELIPIDNGRLVLGTWQGLYLAEFDGPRTRSVVVQFI